MSTFSIQSAQLSKYLNKTENICKWLEFQLVMTPPVLMKLFEISTNITCEF